VSQSVNLAQTRCNGRPKGFVPYRPRGRRAATARRIEDLFAEMRDADALPLGPRQCGYRLSQLYPEEYRKSDFKTIEDILKRLGQACRIPFSEIADASADERDPGGYDGADDYLANLPEYKRDLRHGQPVVIEIYAEARETLPPIKRVAAERGVLVYSGGGSGGPNLAYRAVVRALRRAVDDVQSTLILGICDFDRAGVKNILRPHIEHLAAFLYGTDRRGYENGMATVVADKGVTIDGADTTVSFQHLALTPEQAVEFGLVANTEELAHIERYLDSGKDLWSRDLDHLHKVKKIETEALDPRLLRRLVSDALDDSLDQDQLKATRELERTERESIEWALAGRP
jgi:hypothetical protein